MKTLSRYTTLRFRAETTRPGRYEVASTFLTPFGPGHFG
jgi:hypothetical protein